MKKKIVVYANVVSDLPHRGHIEFFRKAKALGDYLIIGVHPDNITQEYKRKPIMSYEDRIEILKSIKEIDLVVKDCRDKEFPTTYENLKKYNVNIIVHGDDFIPSYTEKAKEMGVKTVLVPYYPNLSTTKLLQNIRTKNTLKNALKANEKLVVVSANDAITAKLVEQYGFDGIWVSSFETSARLGLVDNETINLTDMVTVAKPITDAVNIPVIVDADTGYGNVEQFIRAVKELEKTGVSAVCIEDNTFPKSNSLWGGKKKINDMKKHGAKIRAGKEVQRTKEFCIIARTEALIRGYGIKEALKRANYYAKCGADMILMHSRDKTGKEALKIPKLWKRDTPLIIIPSKFPHLTNKQLFNAGYSIVIYANQTQRAKIYGVKKILQILKTKQNAQALSKYISTLDEFRSLTPIEETKRRKLKYE